MFNINVEEAVKDFKESGSVKAPGWYKVVCVKHEFADNSKNTGKVLTFHWQHTDGDITKSRHNVLNQNQIAQKIAQGEVAKIFESVGITGNVTLESMTRLYGRPLEIKLTIEKFTTKEGDEKDKNEVKGYRKVSTTSAPAEKKESMAW